MKGVVGRVLAIVMFLLYLLVMYSESVVLQEISDQREIISATDEFVDKIIDSREVTDAMISEYEARLASFNSVVTYEVTREMRVLEPDSLHNGEHVPSYIVADTNTRYNQGDLVVVHVKERNYGSGMGIVNSLFNVFVPKLDLRIADRVR